jgi:hypothetical protein
MSIFLQRGSGRNKESLDKNIKEILQASLTMSLYILSFFAPLAASFVDSEEPASS